MAKSYARIDGIIAQQANQAVIFRRGPSKLTQMLLWDMDTDYVTPGQWLKARVHTKTAYLSDDARYVALMAADYRNRVTNRKLFGPLHVREFYLWVAISRPPYFSAIGLWSAIGRFNEKANQFPDTNLSSETVELAKKVFKSNRKQTLQDRGWTFVETAEAENPFARKSRSMFLKLLGVKQITVTQYRKDFNNGFLKLLEDSGNIAIEVYDLQNELRLKFISGKGYQVWVDVDKNNRLVYGDEGCLWAWANFPEGEPNLVANLNGNTFEEVPPPAWALKP